MMQYTDIVQLFTKAKVESAKRNIWKLLVSHEETKAESFHLQNPNRKSFCLRMHVCKGPDHFHTLKSVAMGTSEKGSFHWSVPLVSNKN